MIYSKRGWGGLYDLVYTSCCSAPRPPRRLIFGYKVCFDGFYTYLLENLRSEVIDLREVIFGSFTRKKLNFGHIYGHFLQSLTFPVNMC